MCETLSHLRVIIVSYVFILSLYTDVFGSNIISFGSNIISTVLLSIPF